MLWYSSSQPTQGSFICVCVWQSCRSEKILFCVWKVAALRNSITACQRREENPGCLDLPCLSCLAWMIVRWPWRDRKTTLFEAKKKKKAEYSPQLAGPKILLTVCQFYLFIDSEGWSTIFLRHEGSGGGGRGRKKSRGSRGALAVSEILKSIRELCITLTASGASPKTLQKSLKNNTFHVFRVGAQTIAYFYLRYLFLLIKSWQYTMSLIDIAHMIFILIYN